MLTVTAPPLGMTTGSGLTGVFHVHDVLKRFAEPDGAGTSVTVQVAPAGKFGIVAAAPGAPGVALGFTPTCPRCTHQRGSW